MYEIELKFEDKRGDFLSFLDTQECKSVVATTDEYYDHADSFDLFLKGNFLRMRIEPHRTAFEFKFGTPDMEERDSHTYCNEESFELTSLGSSLARFERTALSTGLLWEDNIKDIEEFLALNNLKPFVRISKVRRTYKLDRLVVSWDQCEELGEFVEIEASETEKSKITITILEIEALAKKFDLKRVKTGYVELYLKRFYPHLYERGKFKE